MTILFWNIRRMGRAKKRRDIKSIVKLSKYWIASFQETKLESISINLVKSACGQNFTEWHLKAARGSSGGLLTCWDPSSVTDIPIHIEEYSITTRFTLDNNSFQRFQMNVYGPQYCHHCSLLFEELLYVKEKHHGLWVILGDFNITRYSYERMGATSSRAASKEFNTCINWL